MQRPLTLTEELERLEQQITLTLQEIDSNFSKAHRIVTSSILPVVEEYANHSNHVWESSKYWKQFFEAAANVSLSGYEEAALEDELPSTSEHTTTELTTPEQQKGAIAGGQGPDDDDDDLTVESPTQISGMQSTPKQRPSDQRNYRSSQTLQAPSPRRYTGKNPLARTDAPWTPGAASTNQFSPFRQDSTFKPADHVDPMLHRSVLDKNYRVQSTPFKTQQRLAQSKSETNRDATAVSKALWDNSPDSSPEMAPPQLRDDFFSPARRTATQQVSQSPGIRKTTRTNDAATTVRNDGPARVQGAAATRTYTTFDSDDEDGDVSLGMSPPKTLQFHIPQSRLMHTPAREASKKIVEDLLATAGMNDDSMSDMDGIIDGSPSVIRTSRAHEDDTF